MEGNRLICGCMRIYEKEIREAYEQGARTFSDVQKMTQAGTSCGNCRILVEKVLRSLENFENKP